MPLLLLVGGGIAADSGTTEFTRGSEAFTFIGGAVVPVVGCTGVVAAIAVVAVSVATGSSKTGWFAAFLSLIHI